MENNTRLVKYLHLKKLEAYGFKSFADKTEINFDNGITAVVGPNGSGKSNISDAIKWVLGEQNVRNIRGVKAEDIIFTGSEARRPMGVAEVSLYFDNEGDLPVDFNEVVITRRLFRTGESEFYINKSRCRLKDITSLFADTGVGHDSMGIISQNKMDEILNARPEEKRIFFEEAAGISKYRQRKKEAMGKLEAAEQNLQRVYDILGEIDNQLEPLRISAEKTKQHGVLQQELNHLLLGELYYKYKAIEGKKSKYTQQIQEKQAQEAAANTAVQLLEGRQMQLEADALALEQELTGAQKHLQEIHALIEKANNDINVLEERRRQGKANKQRNQQLLRDLEGNVGEIEANISLLEKSGQQAQDRQQEVKAQVEQQRRHAKELREKLTALQTEQQQHARQQQELERNCQSLRSRVNILEKLQGNYEGFGRAVRAVLKSQAEWHRGICGAAAELLQVPGKLVTAIEVALGASQQNIVTEDTDTAKAAIAMLKRERLGRATFLPLSSIIVRQNRENLPQNTPGIMGWANELVQADSKYRKVADFLLGRTLIVDNLDNALKLNKSMGQRLRIVTLEGELLTPGGALSGGSQQNKESSFLNRREEIQQLQSKLESLEKENAQAQATVAVLREKYDTLDKQADELAQVTNKLETEGAVLAQQVIHAREQLLLRQRELQRCRESLQQRQEEMSAMDKELADSLSSLETLMESSRKEQQRYAEADEQRKAVYERRMTKLAEKKSNDSEIKAANARLQEVQKQVHQLEMDGARFDFDLEQCQQEMLEKYGLVPERAAEEIADMEAGELKKQIRRLSGELSALGSINPNAPQEYADLQERHGFLSGNAADLEQGKADLLQLIGEMENTMTTQFKEAFTAINRYFGEIFTQLFGGGGAKVQLSDKENVLESGVNIMVTVPGKKVQNLAVLSGGERALTVVALLFSFLKYRPAAFSLLDEIDAPLDEANIGRFCSFLKEYADNTQFIIVTHRKGTMEAADTMYGVTIEEPGVSKVLSVRLQDYEESSEAI